MIAKVFKETCPANIKDATKKKIHTVRLQSVFESCNAFANRRKAVFKHGSARGGASICAPALKCRHACNM